LIKTGFDENGVGVGDQSRCKLRHVYDRWKRERNELLANDGIDGGIGGLYIGNEVV
jgi:hypothetical protein